MTRLLLALALLFGPAVQAVAAAGGQDVIIADRRLPGVADPRAFVTATYARYQAHADTPPPDQSYAYSPRLRRLFNAYDAWQRQHQDLVGALDFDWWTNAQDWELSNLRLTVWNEGRALRWVIARFTNIDRHDEVRFRFVRQGARWYLDDAVEGTGRGDHGWTLSALLRNPAG
jgi:hypothetical protein